MKTYTPQEYQEAEKRVYELVKAGIMASPEADNRPTEEGRAVLGPILAAVRIASLITPELRQALILRQIEKGSFLAQRPGPSADENMINSFLVALNTALQTADPEFITFSVGLQP